MAGLSSLAKDTAIYGLSSIVGRFLNYLLVPLYTAKLSAASGGYGVITNVYAYTALLLVILTYGMETTFFRFANKEGEDPKKVYSTTLTAVGFTSLLFVMGHGHRRGSRRLPVHTLRLSALQEASGEVRGTETVQHRAHHSTQPRVLPPSARSL